MVRRQYDWPPLPLGNPSESKARYDFLGGTSQKQTVKSRNGLSRRHGPFSVAPINPPKFNQPHS